MFLTPLSDSYSVPPITMDKDFYHTYDCGSAQYNVQLVVSPVTDPVSGITTMNQTLYYQTPMADKVGSVPYSSILMVNTISENNALTTGNVAQLHNSFEDEDTQVVKFLSLHLRQHLQQIFDRRYIQANRYEHPNPPPEQIIINPGAPATYAQRHPYWAAFMNPAAALKRAIYDYLDGAQNTATTVGSSHQNPPHSPNHTSPQNVATPNCTQVPDPQPPNTHNTTRNDPPQSPHIPEPPQFVPTPPRYFTIHSPFVPDLDFKLGVFERTTNEVRSTIEKLRTHGLTKAERRIAENAWGANFDDWDVHHHLIDDGKPMMVKTAPNFCHAPNVSVNSKSNLSQLEAIIMRITAVNSDDGTQQFLDDKEGPIKTAFQLWEKIFGDEQVEPLTIEEVAEQNTDANQKKRYEGFLERTTYQDIFKPGSYFTKAEANIGKADPKTRNISNVDDRYIVELSRYTMALKKRINDLMPGYLFSNTNAQTGQYVNDLVSYFGHRSVCDENDHSGFDGHQNAASMLLELGPYYVAMKGHYKDVAKLLEKTHTSCFRSVDHMMVNPGYTRLSGCATTSINNSLIGLIIPCLSRIYTDPSTYSTFIDISGYSREHIRKLFNLTYGGGDDANTYNIDSANLVSFAKHMGFDLKNVSYPATAPTTILGSVFPAPGGSASAHNDYKRQLAKLNLSVINPRFKINEQFALKTQGIQVSNFGSAPAFVAMLSNLTRLTKARVSTDLFDKDMPYNVRHGQYNATDPFTDALDVERMPDGYHDLMQEVAAIKTPGELRDYAEIVEQGPSDLDHERAKENLRKAVADTQTVRVPQHENLWHHLTQQEKQECSRDVTGAVALEAIKQIAKASKHGIYIVDLTPGPEILARTICSALPNVKYYSHHHSSKGYQRAKNLQLIQPIGRNHCRVPLLAHLADHVAQEENKTDKKTMVLILDPPWVDKPIAKGLFSGNASATQIMGVVFEFLAKVRLRSTGKHPSDIKILLHLPKELKTKLPGLKVVEAPVYTHVFYTNFLAMRNIKITVSATKRDAQPNVITRYLDRIVKDLPGGEDISRDLMGRSTPATRHQPPQSPTSGVDHAHDEPANRPLTREDVRKLWTATSENKSAQKRQWSHASTLGETPVETQPTHDPEPQATPPSQSAQVDEQLYSLNNPTLPPLTEQDLLDLREKPRKPRPKDVRPPPTNVDKDAKLKPPQKLHAHPTDGKFKARPAVRPPPLRAHDTNDKITRRPAHRPTNARKEPRPKQERHHQEPNNHRQRRSASLPPMPEERRSIRATAAAAMAAFNARSDPIFRKLGDQ